jgi:hypothetical protein
MEVEWEDGAACIRFLYQDSPKPKTLPLLRYIGAERINRNVELRGYFDVRAWDHICL